MQIRLNLARCVRAAVIMLMLAFVHACAMTSKDHQADVVGMPDNSKPVGAADNQNEKYDAVSSASPRKSDGDGNSASASWLLLAVFGLLAAARHQRARNTINPPGPGLATSPPGFSTASADD